MNDILAIGEQLDFMAGLWAFVVAFALHEAEEWNIIRWYQRNYVDLPPTTDKAARTWIVFISMMGLVWCTVATLPGNPTIAAFVLLPAIALALQNALQHVYWLFYFKQYAPGIISSVVFLIPLGVYLNIQAVSHNYVPIWYAGILALLIIPGLFQTVKAKNRMTPQIRSVHNFSIKLNEWIERVVQIWSG